MSELLAAAKAVIEAADTGDRWCAIANLRTAVERAENAITGAYEHGYIAGQKAMQRHERERIKALILKTHGLEAANLLRMIDAATE